MLKTIPNTVISKLEKSELYTFVVGGAAAIPYCLISIRRSALLSYYNGSIHLPIFIIEVVFYFLFFTGILYALYNAYIYLVIIIVKVILSEKHALGKRILKRIYKDNKKHRIRYLPALQTTYDNLHVMFLISLGLILIFPTIHFLVEQYLIYKWFLHVYLGLMIVVNVITIYQFFGLIVFNMCYDKGCFKVTNNYDEFVLALNKEPE